jgi:hypothetical protein
MTINKKAAPGANRAASISAFDGEIVAEIPKNSRQVYRLVLRTINEHHVDGLRTRQKLFRICPRQRGVIDATLAGLIALAIIGVVLLSGVLT